MKLFKNSNNTIYAYELDGSQDHLIGDKTPITQEEVDAIRAVKTQANFDALTYAEKRASEYPPITDFADAYYWAQKGNTALMDAYVSKCDAIKLKYPK